MKKIVCVLLSLCFVLGMAACSQTTTYSPQGGNEQTGNEQTGNEGGENTDNPSFDGTIALSAQMFDNAYIELDGADEVGLITETDHENEGEERSYLTEFKEDGTFEKSSFIYTAAEGEYEVSQKQIEGYPVNVHVTDNFIFVAYSSFLLEIDAVREDPEQSRAFRQYNENFVIDRATGKIYSLSDLQSFCVISEHIVYQSELSGYNFYYLSIEQGALKVTDLMPNKNLGVYGASEDAFGNVYVYNESITEKTGNFVYSTEAAYIGDDGYAYAYDQKYDWEGYRITVQRYGQDGVLESTRQNVNVVLSYFRNYDCFDKGFVILRGDEMYGVEKSYGFSENYWYARSYDGTGVFIERATAILPSYTYEVLSSRFLIGFDIYNTVWYYDLEREKRVEDDVLEFENGGQIMTANSMYSDESGVYAQVESVQGTAVYKLEETLKNGEAVVEAVPYREIEYDATVVIILPLN